MIAENKSYTFAERTDINWNYWSDKIKYDSSFDLSDKNHNIIFEVTSELDDSSKYLDGEVIKKIILKEKREEIVEVLDI